MGSDEGSYSQEYFVYFKKKWQNQSALFSGSAEGGLCGVALEILHMVSASHPFSALGNI